MSPGQRPGPPPRASGSEGREESFQDRIAFRGRFFSSQPPSASYRFSDPQVHRRNLSHPTRRGSLSSSTQYVEDRYRPETSILLRSPVTLTPSSLSPHYPYPPPPGRWVRMSWSPDSPTVTSSLPDAPGGTLPAVVDELLRATRAAEMLSAPCPGCVWGGGVVPHPAISRSPPATLSKPRHPQLYDAFLRCEVAGDRLCTQDRAGGPAAQGAGGNYTRPACQRRPSAARCRL